MSLYLAQVLDMSDNGVEPGGGKSSLQTPPPPNMNDAANGRIQDHIRTSQLRQLNYEPKPTISDVYHERKIGLGLAPSLLKLLSLDKHQQQQQHSSAATSAKDTSNNKTTSSWLSPSMLKRFGGGSNGCEMMTMTTTSTVGSGVYGELNKRDEGDGRSVAESQSSTGSYHHKNKRTTSAETQQHQVNSFAVRNFESLVEQEELHWSGTAKEPKIRMKKKSSYAPPPPPPSTAPVNSSSSPPLSNTHSSSSSSSVKPIIESYDV